MTILLSYLAGIIDSDGCISITKVRPNGLNKTCRHFLVVSIQMQEKRVIDFLAKKFDRNVIRHKKRGHQKRDSFRVTWQAINAMELLKKVKPYLIGKKDQADIAIQFQNHISSINRRGRGKRISKEEIIKRDKFHQEISQLKHSTKGRSTTIIRTP